MSINHEQGYNYPSTSGPLKIKVPAMVTTRGAKNVIHSEEEEAAGSGSEYRASEKDDHDADVDADGEPEEEPEPVKEIVVSTRGRKFTRVSYAESAPSDDYDDDPPPRNGIFPTRRNPRRSGGSVNVEEEEEDEEDVQPRRRTSRFTRSSTAHSSTKNLEGFVEEDSDAEMHEQNDNGPRRRLRTRNKSKQTNGSAPPTRVTRRSSRRQTAKDNDYSHNDESSGSGSVGSLDADDLDLHMEAPPEPEPEPEDDNDGKPYAFRQRAKVNYAILPPLEEMTRPPPKPSGRHANRGGPKKGRGLGWSASGAELGRWMGIPANDSDSDNPSRSPRKTFGGMNPFGGAVAAGGVLPNALAAAGTPSNLGKIGDSGMYASYRPTIPG